jgi:hypothetical protein
MNPQQKQRQTTARRQASVLEFDAIVPDNLARRITN